MEAWKAHRSVMVQMPTGTGKTHLLASVVSEFVSSAGSGYGLLPIVGNWWRKWRKRWLNIVSGGGYSGQGDVCQWLSRHWNEAGDAPGLIVIDEAHHALVVSYTEMWKRYPAAKKLGVTATPCRLNRRGSRNCSRYWLLRGVLPSLLKRRVVCVRLCIHPSRQRGAAAH